MEFTYQKVKQMDINAETVRPYFENFFTKLSAEQWELLKSCKPDEATTFMLAELLLNLMTSVSDAIVKRRPRSPVSEDKVRSILGDTLTNSLSPGSTTSSESLDKLTDLVVEEVTQTVNSTLSASSICVSSEKLIPTRLIKPAKVQKMICYACEALKTDGRINELVRCQSPKQSWASSSEEQDPTDDPILVSRTSSSSYSSGVTSSLEVNSLEEKRSEQLSPSPEYTSRENERLKQSTPAVVTSRGKKISKQSTPAVVSSSGSKRLKQSTPAVVSSSGSKGSKQSSSSEVSNGGKERLKQSTPAVVTSSGKERLKQSTPAVVTSSGSGSSKQSSSSEASSGGNKRLKQSTPAVVTSRGNQRLKQSTPAVVTSSGKERLKQSSSSEVSKERDNTALSDRRAREKIQAEVKYKMYVSVLSDKLVTRIYKKGKVSCPDDDTRRYLLERIWAEVKDIDSPFIPQRILDMDIFKELFKKWPSPEMLLSSLLERDPELEIAIISIVRRRLCKKPGFVSSYRAGLSSFFGR